MSDPTMGTDQNEVRLRGRITGVPELRQLPSGDESVSFRVTVRRPATERGTVDSIDCVSTRVRVRRSVIKTAVGDFVEVGGTLRRRFWRGADGAQSRYAVDVTSFRKVVTGRATDASPGRKPASA